MTAKVQGLSLQLWKYRERLDGCLSAKLNSLDSCFRKSDWQNNRNHGPIDPAIVPAQERPCWLQRLVGMVQSLLRIVQVTGHASQISIWFLIVLLFMVFGPGLGSRGALGYGLAGGVLVVTGVILRGYASETTLGWIQWVFAAGLALFLWFGLTDASAMASEARLYRHILIPAVGVLLVAILIGKGLAYILFRRYAGYLCKPLQHTELFFSVKDHPTQVSVKAFGRSILTTPLYHPLALVLPAALLVLAVADRDFMKLLALVALIVSWLLLAAGGVHKRLNAMIEVPHGAFFVGGQLIVSLAVVGLALGRLFGQQQITTLIESHPTHVNYTILLYVAVAYTVFWFYEYWINRILNERIIDVFRQPGDDSARGQIRYTVQAGIVDTDVLAKGRVLQTHGWRRFVVVGAYARNGKKYEAWQVYDRIALLDAVVPSGCKTSLPDRMLYKKGVMLQRIRFYFTFLNVLLAGVVFYGAWAAFHFPQAAELTATQPLTRPLFDLRARLFDPAQANASGQAIVLAASGGGTRAALYTESVLHGLSGVGVLDDVVLVSGVSGGSAALAYLVAHYDELQHEDTVAWSRFGQTMAAPFIQDVLEGVVEWRITGGTVQEHDGTTRRLGVRLGELLAESFSRHFNVHGAAATLGGRQNLGLIFNTALVGHFPRWDCAAVGGSVWESCVCDLQRPLSVRESDCRELRTSTRQGGRLVLTNLGSPTAFPSVGYAQAPDEYLAYSVVTDLNVPLARAAALSANFPPVFSNAAVDVDGRARYWVTDGGATDNRGIVSLLYALRDAIEREGQSGRDNVARVRPDIHVIVAEASAADLRYADDRGMGARFGAPAKFASQIMVDLIADIKRRYAALGGKLHVHYLAMPLVLRSNGGLGTHWMLPARVQFNQPPRADAAVIERDHTALSSEETRRLIDALHSEDESRKVSDAEAKVWKWICEDDYTNHQQRWAALVNAVGGQGHLSSHCPTQVEPH
jgi:hypothetical protein